MLLKLFFVLSCVTLPLILTYRHTTYPGIPEQTNTKYARYSVANLGYSSVQCSLTPIAFKKMYLSCPYGEMTKIVPKGAGINLKGKKRAKNENVSWL
jgi:hypothetical protein